MVHRLHTKCRLTDEEFMNGVSRLYVNIALTSKPSLICVLVPQLEASTERVLVAS
jgi:hypothetical protein